MRWLTLTDTAKVMKPSNKATSSHSPLANDLLKLKTTSRCPLPQVCPLPPDDPFKGQLFTSRWPFHSWPALTAPSGECPPRVKGRPPTSRWPLQRSSPAELSDGQEWVLKMSGQTSFLSLLLASNLNGESKRTTLQPPSSLEGYPLPLLSHHWYGRICPPTAPPTRLVCLLPLGTCCSPTS